MSGLLKRTQAYEYVRRGIATGALTPGQKLPPGVELAAQIGVSHITMRAAFKRLERDGLIESVHGRGTFIARSAGKTVIRTIGVVMPSLRAPLTSTQSPMHYSVVSGVIARAEEMRFEIRTLHRHRKRFDLETVRNMDVDAILVVFPHKADAGLLAALKRIRIPMVAVNLLDPSLSARHHCVNADYAGASRESVLRFHRLGRRRIAFATCYPTAADLHPGALLDGYRRAMAELGLRPRVVRAGPIPYGPLQDAASQLMRREAAKLLAADAIVTSHYDEASAIAAVLRERGKSVPGDIAVAGFFDGAAAEKNQVSTWRVPWDEVGRRAVERAADLLADPAQRPRIELLPCKYMARKSG